MVQGLLCPRVVQSLTLTLKPSPVVSVSVSNLSTREADRQTDRPLGLDDQSAESVSELQVQ